MLGELPVGMGPRTGGAHPAARRVRRYGAAWSGSGDMLQDDLRTGREPHHIEWGMLSLHRLG